MHYTLFIKRIHPLTNSSFTMEQEVFDSALDDPWVFLNVQSRMFLFIINIPFREHTDICTLICFFGFIFLHNHAEVKQFLLIFVESRPREPTQMRSSLSNPKCYIWNNASKQHTKVRKISYTPPIRKQLHTSLAFRLSGI